MKHGAISTRCVSVTATVRFNVTTDNTLSGLMASHQRGIGLIEVLIAVVIMSMGFLAAARMQVEGMRFSQSAYYQSQAYFLANDMVDRMRSNITGVEQGYYNDQGTSAAADDPGCALTSCNPRGIARQDLFDWSTSLHSLQGASGFIPALPGSDTSPAQGVIEAMDNSVYAVIMRWSEIIQGENSQQELRIQFALEVS